MIHQMQIKLRRIKIRSIFQAELSAVISIWILFFARPLTKTDPNFYKLEETEAFTPHQPSQFFTLWADLSAELPRLNQAEFLLPF